MRRDCGKLQRKSSLLESVAVLRLVSGVSNNSYVRRKATNTSFIV
jgi:hypothetical protein